MIFDYLGNSIVDVENVNKNMIQIFDKITGIGDSLMAGYSATEDITISSVDAKARGANWFSYMMLDIGRTGTNLAVGNTTTHDWRYTAANADLSTANIETNCYLIGLGVNDSRHNKTIGASSDIVSVPSNNADSFYGNMDYIVRTLHGYNPNAHIFLFTIPGSETHKTEINSAIKYICNLYEYVHCVDLDELYSDEYTSGFINSNLHNGHFNALTYRVMSTYIQKAINDYMFDNYTLFENVPYQL